MSLVSGIQYSTEIIGRRNAIINGDFDIWQRATTQTTDGYGSTDRWTHGHTGTTKVTSRQTFTLGQTDVPNNPTYYSRTIVTSVAGAGNLCNMAHRIEDVRTFEGETITLSFWAKADASKNIALEFYQNFGSGGSPSAGITVFAVKQAITTSWVKYTITTTMPSITGKTLGTDGNDNLQLTFWFDAGSTYNARTDSLGQQNGTFDIAQVQIEKGDVATEFERRSIGEELALCQRYCWVAAPHLVGARSTTASIATYMSSTFPVEMRVSPTAVRTGTVVLTDGTNTRNSVSLTTNNITSKGAALQFGTDGSFASVACAVITVPSSAWSITFDAEI